MLGRGRRGALIVSASRGAADEFARQIALARGGAVGLQRFSFAQLAARLAAPVLAARGLAPVTMIGSEAVAARAAFESETGGELSYFGPVARTPGFPRALARTLHELSLAGVRPHGLRGLPFGGGDLAALLERFDEQFAAAAATDRASLFEAATEAAATLPQQPLLLLDVPVESAVEWAFARALVASAPEALLTIPFGDLATLGRVSELGVEVEVLEPEGPSDVARLCRYLFAARQPLERRPAGDVRLFSAPGEGRECVEIARRVLQEARDGVPFDEMAVLLRSPREYVGLLEDAFNRAGIPAWFDRGTRRPHPAGRAFLALLGCASEKLSAVRFAEYLSLAQVPDLAERAARPHVPPPPDDVVAGFTGLPRTAIPPDPPDAVETEPDPPGEEQAAVVAGSLRAPWMWERLIVDSAVIGGDPGRWRRRLAGLERQFHKQLLEEEREDPDSPRVARLQRDLENLRHLASFALPVIEALAEWPAAATWGDWIARFTALAPKVLRKPARVLRVLGELRAMSAVGPVSLEEVQGVLAQRLRALDEHPPASRYGRVFVGSPHQARGRSFRVVFVPSLAERLFPQKPREDPLLLDKEMREPLAAGLPLQEDRGKTERLLLRLAVGAARERLWLSYPRLDVGGSRPRVPSFYVLDVMRAITGEIPNHEPLQRDAAAEGGVRLDWPAPSDPAAAIDHVEHDLSTLRQLIDAPDRAAVRGHAHYLLRLNDALRRSVTTRWARGRGRWLPQDGPVRVTPAIKPLLDSQRLSARAYSVSALQKFAVCPYQFFLAAVYRLEPNEEPEPLQRLDPLMRGAIFHEIQAGFLRALQQDGRLPLPFDAVPAALRVLEGVIDSVAARHEEELAPAIERVWRDEIGSIRRDLRVWVRRLPESSEWTPEYFEFSFGLSGRGGAGRAAPDAAHDRRSVDAPAIIDGRFRLRGAVDVIEQRAGAHGIELRITDHKTGRNRTTPRTIINGGTALQPIVYGLAVEHIFGRPVKSGRLFYCTAAGGFAERDIPLSDANRRAGVEALEIIDRAIELGFLPPAPAERACVWCDFRTICGPGEAQHVLRKPAEPLGDLIALRLKP